MFHEPAATGLWRHIQKVCWSLEQKAALYEGDLPSTAFLLLERDCAASRGETYREGKPKKGEKVKWPGLGARIEIPCEFIYSTCVGI